MISLGFLRGAFLVSAEDLKVGGFLQFGSGRRWCRSWSFGEFLACGGFGIGN